MHRYRPYLSLAAILILGTVLRFAQLEAKPVWLDEILTGLFSLGRSYQNIPLNALFPLAQLADIFTLNSTASCGQIAETVATESTHPPLFFCLTHEWLSGVRGSWIWQTRSLCALFGVGAIAAMYGLNRIAFSRQAGVMAAAVMAVSPFAVYLSQEARHYTLPMLLIILSLMGFIHIQKDLHHQEKINPVVGISWAIVNTLGLYTHYFFLLAWVAELLTIFALILGKYFHPGRLGLPEPTPPASAKKTVTWLSLAGYSLLPLLFYLPWLPTLYNHFSRPETDWFKPFEPSWVDSVTPIFQTLAGWLVMIVAFPVENQPLWIVIPSAILMLLWCGYFLIGIVPRIKAVLNNKNTRLSGLSLLGFTAVVLLEYLTIVYGLGKDITSAVRYHFIYYPGICALLGASLIIKPPNPLTKTPFSILARAGGLRPYSPTLQGAGAGAFLIVGIISSVFVLSNGVFQKPYDPAGVAQQLNLEPNVPLVVVVGYENMQEVALGLSFALELDKMRGRDLPETSWAFMNRSPSYQSVWENLGTVSGLPPSPVNLWMVAPGLRQREYPPQLGLGDRLCTLDPSQYYRLGIPYQLYRCK
ncbi:glycosyltransferase family 39 protein [Oscillatoria acuminata]|uniref:Putative membrane protein n=1 Tax=Oscillatoria acuminata PCC 6304 TaxID=56110 RepID=K9TQM3_9CYAN|nr:glycosyltransferase family 39 protein [Oscillatoria acuminata]AFY85162.1 putative membrane protein [Oscillatoria acuminata PCC 6304]